MLVHVPKHNPRIVEDVDVWFEVLGGNEDALYKGWECFGVELVLVVP